MSNGNSSYLRFSVEESIWFQKGHEVEELVSISLSPDVVIQETREYVLIRGSLELTGEYQSKLDMVEVQPELSSSGEKFMEILEVKENGNCFFRYYFPVDITIRREKIVNVQQVDFLVDNFDYHFPERSCLKLTANLLVTGLMEETVTKQEMQNFSQPQIFAPYAQARKTEVATPASEVPTTVNAEERESLFEQPQVAEQVEQVELVEQLDSTERTEEVTYETQMSNLEEIIRQQKEEIAAQQVVTSEEVFEQLVVEEEVVVVEEVEEAQDYVIEEEEENTVEIEVVFEEPLQAYEPNVVEEDVNVTYEETVEDLTYPQATEQDYVAYEDTSEEAYPVYEEVRLATFPVYEEEVAVEEVAVEEVAVEEVAVEEVAVEEVAVEEVAVEEVAVEPVVVEQVEVAPSASNKKSRFGFDIFLSNKNKKDKPVEETVEAKQEEVEKKQSTGKVALTEFFSSKTEETNVKLKLYFIQPNDTLETIAEKYNTTLINLLKYNKLDSASQLTPGEILYVPRVTVKK